MKPIVTIAEMRSIDDAAPVSHHELVDRAAWAVARAAIRMLGGTYGRRVVVVAGPGSNGADGRKAAELLRARGVRIEIVESNERDVVPRCDLVIDAAFGTGFRGEYVAPDVGDAVVLAVDIPSGVNGDTGEACPGAVWADHTVTFAALKPGQLLGDGPERCGTLELADIGLDVSRANMQMFEPGDLDWILPKPSRNSHKWKSAVGVVAGSPGMMGASRFVTWGAQRAGAGMVRLLSPGVSAADNLVGEAVVLDGSDANWADSMHAIAGRLHAVVVGPGLGRSNDVRLQVGSMVRNTEVTLIIDADGIVVLADEDGKTLLRNRTQSTVLTPHDGEFAALTGAPPGADRVADVRRVANDLQCVVLSKGSTTVVADPGGQVWFSTTGSARLASAGTGDVLAGIIGAFVASGVDAALAAVAAAHVHGAAAKMSYSRGLKAGDLPENVAALLSTH